jgi:hypothetical protein
MAQPTPQEMAEWQRREKKAQEAKERAEALLLEHLSPVQRETYQRTQMFVVETPKRTRYRLGLHGQPVKLDGERPTHSFCIHTYGVPREDELLGFKLLLEANEDEFLKTANATRLAA